MSTRPKRGAPATSEETSPESALKRRSTRIASRPLESFFSPAVTDDDAKPSKKSVPSKRSRESDDAIVKKPTTLKGETFHQL